MTGAATGQRPGGDIADATFRALWGVLAGHDVRARRAVLRALYPEADGPAPRGLSGPLADVAGELRDPTLFGAVRVPLVDLSARIRAARGRGVDVDRLAANAADAAGLPYGGLPASPLLYPPHP